MASITDLDLQPLAPHPEAAAAVRDLVTTVGHVLGDEVIGVWFDGSIALGDFDPERSDVDLVVLLSAIPIRETVAAIGTAHAAFAARPSAWGQEIEVIYVTREALRREAVSVGVVHHYVERGTGGAVRARPLDPGWLVHLRVLREHGISIAGPTPADLVEAVSDDELRRTARWGAERWLTPYRDDPASLAALGERAFAVLAACRFAYRLNTGRVVPKMTAARWALSQVPGSLAPVIEGAMAWRKDDASSDRMSVEGVLALIGWTQSL